MRGKNPPIQAKCLGPSKTDEATFLIDSENDDDYFNHFANDDLYNEDYGMPLDSQKKIDEISFKSKRYRSDYSNDSSFSESDGFMDKITDVINNQNRTRYNDRFIEDNDNGDMKNSGT
eukprot:Awhi_evm1s9809